MIVDVETHLWTSIAQLGKGGSEFIQRECGRADVAAGPAEHGASAECVDKTLVMGYRSAVLDASVPNEAIADYVGKNHDSLIGIGAVDPTDADVGAQAAALLERKEFRGLTLSPSTQNFHPADSRAMALYEIARDKGAPIFFTQGTHFPHGAWMEHARPLLLDEIAREYPRLTIVITAMGHPWVEEGIALIGKHERVFASVAGLLRRPWQAYNALVLAHQYNVMDKVLFGSDFPYFSAPEAIKAVYRLHEVTQGTNLPAVPRETLRAMVERNTLAVLGIARPGEDTVAATEEEDEL